MSRCVSTEHVISNPRARVRACLCTRLPVHMHIFEHLTSRKCRGTPLNRSALQFSTYDFHAVREIRLTTTCPTTHYSTTAYDEQKRPAEHDGHGLANRLLARRQLTRVFRSLAEHAARLRCPPQHLAKIKAATLMVEARNAATHANMTPSDSANSRIWNTRLLVTRNARNIVGSMRNPIKSEAKKWRHNPKF